MIYIPSVSRLALKEIDEQNKALNEKIEKDISYLFRVSKFVKETLANEAVNNSLCIEDYIPNNRVNNGEYRKNLRKLKSAQLLVNSIPLTPFNQNFGSYSVQVNSMLTDDNVPAGYRKIDVEFNREIFGDDQISRPPWEVVPKYMKELQDLLIKKQPVLHKISKKHPSNYSPIHPVEYSALAHQYITYIHPFEDGSGRYARLVGNHYLNQYGLPSISINLRERSFYFELLKNGDEGIIENNPKKGREFYEFIASKVNMGLDRILKEV